MLWEACKVGQEVNLSWFSAFLLGIVQGFTELLPVSSSGHLVIFEKILGVHLKDVSFEVSVHVATAAALCVVLRREIWLILRSLLPSRSSRGSAAPDDRPALLSPDEARRGRLLLLAVVVGSIPAGLAGFALSDQIESIFHGVRLTLVMLPVTGVFLILTRWAKDKQEIVSPLRSLVIGIAQAIAILPGISRSGATIGTGLFLGVKKEEAVKFSFLLSIPAIGGAALLKLAKSGASQVSVGAIKTGAVPGVAGVSGQNLAIAAVVSFLSALLAARLLLGVVRRGKLEYFGYYCIAAGILGLVFLTH